MEAPRILSWGGGQEKLEVISELDVERWSSQPMDKGRKEQLKQRKKQNYCTNWNGEKAV